MRHDVKTLSTISAVLALAGALALPASASAATGTALSLAGFNAQLDAEIERVLASSPKDLAGRTAAQNVEAVAADAVRCADLDNRIYCLQLGWVDAKPSPQELRQLQAPVQPTSSARGESTGDLPFATQVRQWAAKPHAQRVAADRAELAEARAALGKVKVFDRLLDGKPVPADLVARYPETKTLVADSEAVRAAAPVSGFVSSHAKTVKQLESNWCGPATMVHMTWADPKQRPEWNGWGTSYAAQQHWAKYLGTTKEGTSIQAMNNMTNRWLTWKEIVRDYAVVGVGSWDVNRWISLFQTHIRGGGTEVSGGASGAPIILHPRVNAPHNAPNGYPAGTYYAGHFNFGRGFAGDWISVFESAGDASRVPKFIGQPASAVRQQHLDHPMRNISY